MSRVILDTGPLVALLDQSEYFHSWAVQQLKSIQVPLITCEAVIAEACFLLRPYPPATATIGTWIERGIIEPRFVLAREADATFSLLKKFSDVPVSFADACLVRLTVQYPDHQVFTLDKDLLIYRTNRRQRIQVLMPDR